MRNKNPMNPINSINSSNSMNPSNSTNSMPYALCPMLIDGIIKEDGGLKNAD
jgi:hypothetical protein